VGGLPIWMVSWVVSWVVLSGISVGVYDSMAQHTTSATALAGYSNIRAGQGTAGHGSTTGRPGFHIYTVDNFSKISPHEPTLNSHSADSSSIFAINLTRASDAVQPPCVKICYPASLSPNSLSSSSDPRSWDTVVRGDSLLTISVWVVVSCGCGVSLSTNPIEGKGEGGRVKGNGERGKGTHRRIHALPQRLL